jgi:hypothetical protein
LSGGVPTATLAGVPLSGIGRLGWALTSGVFPYQRTFEVSNDRAQSLMNRRGSPVDLEIRADGRPSLVVRGLYILTTMAGTTPHTQRVLVTDRRWHLMRRFVARDYNMRRRTGENRRVGDDRIENQKLAADVAYAPWSLDNGAPWTAERMLRDVLEQIAPGEWSIGGGGVKRQVLVEDLALGAAGESAAEALERALSYLAGYSVTVDLDGRLRVFDAHDLSEVQSIANAGPLLKDTGGVVLSDRAYSRPSEIRVLFEREVVLRFDYTEEENPAATTVSDGREPRKLENIMPVPDPTIEIGGREVGQGTWVTIDEYLEAISGEETTTAAAALGPLSQAIIRKYYLGMWDYLASSLYGKNKASGQPDPVWQNRLATIRRHWRITYRPLRQWRDKIRSMKAYRADMLDNETGIMAPAQAFMDYISKPTRNALAKIASDNADIGHQVAGYADLLADGVAAPADITVKDDQSGIVRVWLMTDPWGDADELAPGNVANLPTRRVNGDLRNAAGTVYATWQYAALESDFSLALVLTCLQAAPNSASRFHQVTVKPDEAATALGRAIGESSGPPWTIMLAGGLVTARFAWDDARATEIEDAFYGTAAGGGVAAGGKIGIPEELLVNKEEIDAAARATAARIYATLLDKADGQFSVALNPGVLVTGAIRMVDHALDPNGGLTTSISIAEEREPLNTFALMPESAQRVIRRLVQPS